MKHEAIYKAYPEVVSVDDTAGAFDKDGNILELDLDKLAIAQEELDAELANLKEIAEQKKEAAEAKLAALGLTIEDLQALGL